MTKERKNLVNFNFAAVILELQELFKDGWSVVGGVDSPEAIQAGFRFEVNLERDVEAQEDKSDQQEDSQQKKHRGRPKTA